MIRLKKMQTALARALDLENATATATNTQSATGFDHPGTRVSVLDLPHLRFEDLMTATGLRKSTLWGIQQPGSPQFDETFPPSYRLTARTRVWNTAAVLAWIHSKEVLRQPILNSSTSDSEGGQA